MAYVLCQAKSDEIEKYRLELTLPRIFKKRMKKVHPTEAYIGNQ